MKRVYVDERIGEIIKMQTKKCEKLLEKPTDPRYAKAEKCLKELQALTNLISDIESLKNGKFAGITPTDTNSKNYRVSYVSSKEELNKIFKNSKHFITEPLDENCHEFTTRKGKLSDMGMYVKVIKCVSDRSCSEEFMRKAMLEKMWENYEKTGKYAITPEQFEKLWDEVVFKCSLGQTATFFVSIRQKL